MDPEISGWVLEFLLQQHVSDGLINKLLTKLPMPHNNLHLKKCFLLKALKDASVSEETTLDMLESIEAIEKQKGKAVPESLKKAYCAVALECTLRESGEIKGYMEAVERVWKKRIGKLEERGSELVTEELGKWRYEVEASGYDLSWRSSNRREDAASLLRRYSEEASEEPFLQLVAKMEREELGPAIPTAGEADGVLRKRKHPVQLKRIANRYRRSKGRARIAYSEDDDMASASRNYTFPPSHEIEEVLEALKISMKDPLPDAMQFAASFRVETKGKALQQGNQSEKAQGSITGVGRNKEKEVNTTNPPIEEVTEPRQAAESSGVIPSSSRQNKVSKPNIKEWNKTAQTYEKPQPTKTRRKSRRWSLEEEAALENGVKKFGMGNWKLILNSKRDIFVGRTEVDLKDKWRNLTR